MIAIACCVAAALLVPAGAAAGCGKTKRWAAAADAGLGPAAPLAIGDSVMLGAAAEIASLGYDVDVRGCRQVSEGIRVLRRHARRDTLPRLVVVALGSNWTFTTRDVRRLLRLLGPRRLLGLVTPRELRGVPDDAPVLRAAARRWPNRIALVDWAERARKRPRLTGSDGIHLSIAGRRAFARMLAGPLARARGETTAPAVPPSGGGTDGGGATAP
ncbi:MAG: hypothetical protein GXY03_00600 [Solirubrobacterales bacterium]|nr:hypothetical protein [Solirubrobacterales bacterium]